MFKLKTYPNISQQFLNISQPPAFKATAQFALAAAAAAEQTDGVEGCGSASPAQRGQNSTGHLFPKWNLLKGKDATGSGGSGKPAAMLVESKTLPAAGAAAPT